MSLAEWWEKVHRTPESHHYQLTGTSLDGELGTLGVVATESPILVIGVGFGNNVRGLVERGFTVDALDIAPSALDRVRGVARQVYRSADPLPAGEYALILSLLVSQHMTDQELAQQIGTMITALSPTGIFAFQFAEPLEEPLPQTEAVCQQGHATRSRTLVREWVQAAGGIVQFHPLGEYPYESLRWVVGHARRDDR